MYIWLVQASCGYVEKCGPGEAVFSNGGQSSGGKDGEGCATSSSAQHGPG